MCTVPFICSLMYAHVSGPEGGAQKIDLSHGTFEILVETGEENLKPLKYENASGAWERVHV